MKLNIGEIRCPYCEFGRVIQYDDDGYCGTKECSFCLGKAKLDWIEQVIGVNHENSLSNQKKKCHTVLTGKVLFSNLLNDWKKSTGELYGT